MPPASRSYQSRSLRLLRARWTARVHLAYRRVTWRQRGPAHLAFRVGSQVRQSAQGPVPCAQDPAQSSRRGSTARPRRDSFRSLEAVGRDPQATRRLIDKTLVRCPSLFYQGACAQQRGGRCAPPSPLPAPGGTPRAAPVCPRRWGLFTPPNHSPGLALALRTCTCSRARDGYWRILLHPRSPGSAGSALVSSPALPPHRNRYPSGVSTSREDARA